MVALASGVWVSAALLARSEKRRREVVAREPVTRGGGGPLVSIVIPARDEADEIAQTVESLLAQTHEDIELVVVDDQSADGTATAAQDAIGDDPRARVLHGGAPPEGWLGKPWACTQGVLATRGEWLLFSDADVRHEPTALARALGLARRLEVEGVSLLPHIRTGSLAEQIVLPAALTAISTFVAPGPLVRSRRSRVAISVGGWTLITRAAYEAIGGHEAVSDRVAEDVELARNAKAEGVHIVLADGVELASLRMYRGLTGLWRGWSKNAGFGVRGGAGAALAGGVALGYLAMTPPTATVVGLVTGRRAVAAAGAAGWVAQAALHAMARPAVETRGVLSPAFPLGMSFLSAVTMRGSLRRAFGGGTVWRGRRYEEAR
jgi:hypothetical protein